MNGALHSPPDALMVPRAVLDLRCYLPPDSDPEGHRRALLSAERYERTALALYRPGALLESCLREAAGIRADRLARCRVAWEERYENLVTTPAKNDVGEVYFRSGTQRTAWFVGLCTYSGGTSFTPQLTDTMASHPGWLEVTGYSNAGRPALTLAPFSAGFSSNAASPAVFSMSATFTVVGGFLCSVTTKGGTTGQLYNVVGNASSVNTGPAGSTLTGTMSLTMA